MAAWNWNERGLLGNKVDTTEVVEELHYLLD